MDGNHYMSGMGGDQMYDDMEAAYPEVARRMQPYIDDALETFMGGPITESEIGRMTSDAVHTSGILNDPPRGHSPGTVSDIARTMVLAGLLSPLGGPFDYGYFPPFVSPFFFGPFRGGHRFGRFGHFRGGRRR
ncbi:MAG: hypothetical protein FWH06_08155 [Oscillospiraceae bacterium]|nr:hypothetical protein [Oscillospiraceae bacterium]